MGKKTKTIIRPTAKEPNKRLVKAEKNLEEMQKKIAPFLKRRKFMDVSTTGRWAETSSLYK